MRWKEPLLCLGLALAAWQWANDRPIERRPGVLVADEPMQVEIEDGATESIGDFTIRPRAEFSGTVRVLAREHYRLDHIASVAPYDFAVGWGPMSDTAILDQFRISQSGRFYFWRADALPLPRDVIETHSSNWHLVPANAAIRRDLERVRVGDVVMLRGELVDLSSPATGELRTSLRRDDTGAGACEIVRVAEVKKL